MTHQRPVPIGSKNQRGETLGGACISQEETNGACWRISQLPRRDHHGGVSNNTMYVRRDNVRFISLTRACEMKHTILVIGTRPSSAVDFESGPVRTWPVS